MVVQLRRASEVWSIYPSVERENNIYTGRRSLLLSILLLPILGF